MGGLREGRAPGYRVQLCFSPREGLTSHSPTPLVPAYPLTPAQALATQHPSCSHSPMFRLEPLRVLWTSVADVFIFGQTFSTLDGAGALLLMAACVLVVPGLPPARPAAEECTLEGRVQDRLGKG